jgi:hypothetical protein
MTRAELPPILKKVQQTAALNQIRTVPHTMPDKTMIHYYSNSSIGNIVFDKTTSEAYGMFDDGKIEPLTEVAIRWCEKNNLKIRDDGVSDEESVASSNEDDEIADVEDVDDIEEDDVEEDDDVDDVDDDDD